MSVDWNKVQQALYPMKDYEDLAGRLERSFGYPFVRESFNFTMPQLVEYTRLGVGSDPKNRYADYAALLTDIFNQLNEAGSENLQDLCARTGSRDKLQDFSEETGIQAEDIALVLKYVVYWFIPGEKYLSGLIRPDPGHATCLEALRDQG